jgi:Fe-S-cluster-containing dehydrogenase component
MDRVDAGLKPACVSVCTTQCLDFGQVEQMTHLRRQRHAKAVASLEHSSF